MHQKRHREETLFPDRAVLFREHLEMRPARFQRDRAERSSENFLQGYVPHNKP